MMIMVVVLLMVVVVVMVMVIVMVIMGAIEIIKLWRSVSKCVK